MSLSVLFERGKFKLPQGDEHSRNMSDVILDEFNSVTHTNKGLQSVAGHDDCPMSTWLATIGAAIGSATQFDYEFV